jgi:methylenetetrahydrofolate reductase (NADPH)
MFMPGGYSPNRLVLGLRSALADPESNFAGFHIYTFNDVEKTEAWRREMLKRVEAA